MRLSVLDAVASAQEVEALVMMFAAIASEQGWETGDQLRAYSPHSCYFALRTCGGEFAGGLQLVVGNEAGELPYRSVWPELNQVCQESTADIALLVLKKEYRGRGDLFWLLCIAMWRYCVEQGITELWAEVTPANLRRYRRLGWPLQVMGPLRPHWGEDCYPCRMGVQEVAAAIAAKAAAGSERYQSILAHACRDWPESTAGSGAADALPWPK